MLRHIVADFRKSRNSTKFFKSFNYARVTTPVINIIFSLEISQNSQENTCARDSFLIKLQALASNFIKKESLAHVFSCEFCEISKSTCFFTEQLWWLLLIFQSSWNIWGNYILRLINFFFTWSCPDFCEFFQTGN